MKYQQIQKSEKGTEEQIRKAEDKERKHELIKFFQQQNETAIHFEQIQGVIEKNTQETKQQFEQTRTVTEGGKKERSAKKKSDSIDI